MRVRKTMLSIVAGAIGVLAVAAPALASDHSQSAGGGTWKWGTTGTENYSNYYHGSKKHRSSVDNPEYGVVRSACVAAGSWSYAWEPQYTDGNKAYWSTDACA